jgi:hypothetical protein
MYDRTESPRVARRQAEALPGRNPEEAARRALERVRKALTAFRPGMPLDGASLSAALAATLTQPAAEAERLFALGWLHWLDGAFAGAEAPLMQAADLARRGGLTAQLAEAAYWLARVRIRLDRPDAVSDFEALLRHLGGSPQATAWFVDLLWRVGRVGRAEQVWASVRGNKRVAACPDAPLLEARLLLHRGDAAGAVRVLVEVQPAGGVLRVERQLLLAWSEVMKGRRDRALEFLRRIEELPYPRAVLALWKDAVERPTVLAGADGVPPVLRDLDRGYRALLEGHGTSAAEAFRGAQQQQAALPFARYALARLGHDNVAGVLASQPGMFLAVRCRVRLALERFRTRLGTPAEWLETLQHEGRLGYVGDGDADHFRLLGQTLRQPPDSEALRRLIEEQGQAEPAARRNVARAALEVVRRLPAAEAGGLLGTWEALDWIAADAELSAVVGRQLRRLSLQQADGRGDPGELLSGEPSLRPLLELCQASRRVADDEPWRECVRGLRSSARVRPLAQALLLQEAARRGDTAAVVALLEDGDAWRGFRQGPPAFVLRAAESVANVQAPQPALRRTVARWLQTWDVAALGEGAAALAAFAGLTGVPASRSGPPAGVPLVAWLLHQAARALGRDDVVEALACVRRAQQVDPDWATVPDADVVRDALPELERRALAHALATALRPGDAGPTMSERLLTDFVDLLRQQPDGDAIVEAATRGETSAVRSALAALANRPDLPARLAHHLALTELRMAEAVEDGEEQAAADAHWRLSWGAWLRYLAAPPEQDGPATPDAPGRLLDWLLAGHRGRIVGLLARNAVDAARRHWSLVQELPAVARRQSEALAADVAGRIERFRDELASEYLVTTREAMRYGDIPEGWRADYEKGLSHLRRLLSLDRDNVRLLTALVEVCGDWFLDLYNTEDRARLTEQVERFAPFATQLVRLTEERPGGLSARAALSEFFKFRGFVAADPAARVAMYREAMRLNSANENVRDLLKALGEEVV